MSGYEQCPECLNYSLVYDEYYKRWMCLIVNCSASELSSKKIRKFAEEVKIDDCRSRNN